MGKGVGFIVVFCIFIIGTFILMIYLMGNINPPKLEENATTENFYARKYDNVSDDYFNSTEEDMVFKGLRKANSKDRYILTVTNSPQTVTPKVNKTSSTPTTVKVDNVLSNGTIVIHCHSPHDTNYSTHNDTYTAFERKKTSVKSRRRSVNGIDKKISGPVSLKILDDFGDPRVEIKLEPIRFAFNMEYRSSLNKIDSHLNADDDFFINNQVKNMNDTEIIIMPNNSIVFNEAVNNLSRVFNSSKVLNNNAKLKVNDHIHNFDEGYMKNLSEKMLMDNIIIRSDNEYSKTTHPEISTLKLLLNNKNTSNHTIV